MNPYSASNTPDWRFERATGPRAFTTTVAEGVVWARSEPRRLAVAAWAAYFAVSALLWFPGVGAATMSMLKGTLFAAAAVLTVLAVRRPGVPRGVLGPVGAGCVVLASGFALFQTTAAGTIGQSLLGLALPFVTLWAFWNLRRTFVDLVAVTLPAGIFLATLSLLVLADRLGIVSIVGPAEFGSRPISTAGFARASTDWSNAVASFVPFLLVIIASSKRGKAATAAIAAALLVAGQATVGGRTGVIISAISMAAIALVLAGRKRQLLAMGLLALVVALPVASSVATSAVYPSRTSPALGLGEAINEFSTNRVELMVSGWSQIAARPLTGYGFGNDLLTVEGYEFQVHNTWMRMAVQGGIVFPLAFFVVIMTATLTVIAAARTKRQTGEFPSLLAGALVIVGGLLATMVEPNAVVGTFHKSAIWWAVAGAALAAMQSPDRTRDGDTSFGTLRFRSGLGS